ncbi:uncharacterized protein LOC121999466 [Zingiber officinale]|uniref:uncharacterized protein LOC121999466 n=1 Tax=Zingiber officinale TaxID=94328 RepID=UPI001C4C3616|nr:uncharacterized protein LOC121999466 [Zingiber officinale]
MKYHLKMPIEMWIIIQTCLELPLDGVGKPVSCQNWDTTLMKKIEVDAKATCTLQFGLTKEKLNQVSPFKSAKELWEKLIELHKGTSDTKEGESASKLHAWIQDLLNGLHAVSQKVKNRDIIRNEQNMGIKNKAQN